MTAAAKPIEGLDALAGRDGREDEFPALAAVLAGAAESIAGREEKSWHVETRSPRWALGHGAESRWLRGGMLLLALVLAGLGFFLAVHTVDRVLPAPGKTAMHTPLVLLLGTWSVIFLIFSAALGAGLCAYRSGRLELRMSAQPSAAAEAQRAAEMQAHTVDAILELAFRRANIADSAQIGAELQKLAGALPGGVSPAPTTQPGAAATPTAPATTTTVVDPARVVSPKVLAGTATSATSAAFWIVAAATFWHTLEPTVLTALGTGVTAISGAVAAWWKTDPLRVKQLTESHPT